MTGFSPVSAGSMSSTRGFRPSIPLKAASEELEKGGFLMRYLNLLETDKLLPPGLLQQEGGTHMETTVAEIVRQVKELAGFKKYSSAG